MVGVLLIDFLASKLWSWFKIYNIFTNHIYNLFQFVALSFFYSLILKTQNQLRILYVFFILILSFLLLRYLIYPELFFKYSLIETYLTTMPLIIYAVMHLYNCLGGKKDYYYINLGVLFYLFCSTFLFLTYELLSVLNVSSDLFNRGIEINILLQDIKFIFFLYQLKFSKNG